MRCFVTGATGYIGSAVSRALRRAGHRVKGLTRSEEKAGSLEAAEIEPVVGDMRDPSSFRSRAEECSVFVHAAADYEHDTAEADRAAVEALIELAAGKPSPGTLGYTSGVWVHGNTGDRLADESDALAPPEVVAWRPDVERLVVGAEGVRGLVLRPGCVYGGAGGLTGLWFGPAAGGEELEVVGDGENRWAMVHVEDLADAYLRAVESGLGGEIFLVTDRSRSRVSEMVEAVVGVTGYPGDPTYRSANDAASDLGPMAEALTLAQHLDARKAVRLLDWRPLHGGFVDAVDLSFRAWRARNT